MVTTFKDDYNLLISKNLVNNYLYFIHNYIIMDYYDIDFDYYFECREKFEIIKNEEDLNSIDLTFRNLNDKYFAFKILKFDHLNNHS